MSIYLVGLIPALLILALAEPHVRWMQGTVILYTLIWPVTVFLLVWELGLTIKRTPEKRKRKMPS